MAKARDVREKPDGSLVYRPEVPRVPQRRTELEKVVTDFPDALSRDPNPV